MKKIIIIIPLFLLLLFAPSCYAEEIDIGGIYSEQFESSGAGDISDSLPDDVKEWLDDIDISDYSASWKDKFSPHNIFSEIGAFLKSGFKLPFTAGCTMIAILLFGAAAGGMTANDKIIKYVLSVGITAAAVLPAVSCISSCISAIKSSSVFMTSFVPVYAGILVARGKALTAAGFSSVLLIVAEAVTGICSFVVVPLTGMQLALGVSSSVLTEINISSVGKALKRAASWTLSLSSTVMLGLLGIQTLIGSPADTLTAKTTKFIVGTAVPVVGSAVSEAMATVRGCLKVLGSSVAIYAVAAIALIFLPVIIELFMWRIALLVCAAVAEMLSQESTAALIRTVDSAMAFILGVMVLVSVMFIISITMVAII